MTANESEPTGRRRARRGSGRRGVIGGGTGGESRFCAARRSERAAHRRRRQQLGQHARRDADQVAAPAAVDADRGRARGSSPRRRPASPCACRTARCRRPGSRCARSARLGRARLDALDADRARQVLRADLRSPCIRTISGSRLLVLHHQRLDDRVLVDAELARRLGGAAVLDVGVDVLAEGDAVRGAATASPASR